MGRLPKCRREGKSSFPWRRCLDKLCRGIRTTLLPCLSFPVLVVSRRQGAYGWRKLPLSALALADGGRMGVHHLRNCCRFAAQRWKPGTILANGTVGLALQPTGDLETSRSRCSDSEDKTIINIESSVCLCRCPRSHVRPSHCEEGTRLLFPNLFLVSALAPSSFPCRDFPATTGEDQPDRGRCLR